MLASIVDASPVPVYTFWSSLMESGTEGDDMIDGQTMASRVILDWSALARYRIEPLRGLGNADDAMYRVMAQGKNRVCN